MKSSTNCKCFTIHCIDLLLMACLFVSFVLFWPFLGFFFFWIDHSSNSKQNNEVVITDTNNVFLVF